MPPILRSPGACVFYAATPVDIICCRMRSLYFARDDNCCSFALDGNDVEGCFFSGWKNMSANTKVCSCFFTGYFDITNPYAILGSLCDHRLL